MKQLLLLLLLLPAIAFTQKKIPAYNPNIIAVACNFPGTTPGTSTPVCGTQSFPQTKFVNCDDGLINQTFCPGDAFGSRFAFWYRFTCFNAGDLEFLITPSSPFDIDWSLFDVTGHLPNDVLTTPTPLNPCFAISLNGTGATGTTGCSSAGTSNVVCYSGGNRFNRPEPLTVAHQYLLMVQNYSMSDTSSYTITFGGTAGITDGTPPTLNHIESGCSSFNVVFSTDIKCTSVTSLGSELTINPGNIKPASVTSICNSGSLTTTSITVNLATPLAAGNYTLVIDKGSDANTYTNICGNEIAPGTTMNFTVLQPKGNFTLPPETCRGTATSFVSSSDPLPGNTITEYHWDFGDPASGVLNTSQMQSPSHTFTAAGNFLVKHWIVNSVGCISDTSEQIVTVNPLPTAAFTYTLPSCETRVISFTDGSNPNVGALNQWTWDFGDGPPTSSLQNPTHVYAAGTYNATLIVRNDKGCVSTVSSATITIDNRPQAGFIIPEVCLNDSYAQFIDTSKLLNSALTNWQWDFGDANANAGNPNTSTTQNPRHSYTAVGPYNVRLIVWNSSKNCRDTITQPLFINGSNPLASFNVNNPATLCANEPVSLVEASSVFPGNITKVEIWYDNVNAGPPGLPDFVDNFPVTGKVYTHLYPNFQSPLTKTYQIRYRAYSGSVCLDDSIRNITLNAAPLVQFNSIHDTCLLTSPFQLTQASYAYAGTGTEVYSGPGVSSSGMFNPLNAGIGTHTITYTFTATPTGCTDSKSSTITVLDTAHAKFSVVLPSCEQIATTFTDQSTAPASVAITNTVWDFGDLQPTENHAPGSTFTHLFPGPGTYTVTMYNVSTASCLSTNTSQTIHIDANHTIGLTSNNNNQTLCVNKPIADIHYQLSGGATNITPAGLPPGVNPALGLGDIITLSGTPTLAGTYNYTLQTTGNTCQVASVSGVIIVKPDDIIALNASSTGNDKQSVCVNTRINDIVFDLGGGATGFKSIVPPLPAGIFPTVVNNKLIISGTPTTWGGGPDYLITTNGDCVQANASFKINVHPYPVAEFKLDKTSYCIPNAIVKFNNTSYPLDGSDMTYLWDFGEPLSGLSNQATSLNASHWYSGTGPFNVTLSVTSIAVPILNGGVQGCKHDTIIAVNTIHPQPVAGFYQSQQTACLGDEVAFIDSTNQNTGVTTEWHWDMGDGVQKDVLSFTHIYPDTLAYNLSFYTVNIYGCNSDTINKLFKVYPNPTVFAGEDKTVLQDAIITLNPVATGADLQYLWSPNMYFQNGNNGIKSPVTIAKENITYTLTVTSRGGCKRHDDIYIKILKPPLIPNTFTPNNDGTNEKWVIRYLDDYPDCIVNVFNRSGQLLFKSVKGYKIPWDGKLKGKPLPVDTYYYIIEPGFGRDPITGYITIMK